MAKEKNKKMDDVNSMKKDAKSISKSIRSEVANASYKKRAVAILCIIAVLLSINIFFFNYGSSTGSIQVQTVTNEKQPITIDVKGIAIRDENSVSQSKTNTASPKIKLPSGVCEEIVDDGEYVSYQKQIAYVFSSENQREKYVEYKEAQSELEGLKSIKEYSSGIININAAELALTNVLGNYNKYSNDNNLGTSFDEYITDLTYRINTRSETKNIDKSISNTQSKVSKLKNKVRIDKTIYSPSAGYYVNNVDGCEECYDYADVEKSGIKLKQLNKLMKLKPASDNKYLGKIVYQNNWYFVFKAPKDFAGEYLKRDERITIYVSFPGKDVYDLPMVVTNKQRDGKNVSVCCRCAVVSPEILHFRIEDAVVSAKKISGSKIPKSSLVSKGKVQGVYVKIGNRSIFKPVSVAYTSDDFAIVKPVEYDRFIELYGVEEFQKLLSKNATKLFQYKISETKGVFDEKADMTEDEKKTLNILYKQMYTYDKRLLSEYDKIITKGRNLYDGKFIN